MVEQCIYADEFRKAAGPPLDRKAALRWLRFVSEVGWIGSRLFWYAQFPGIAITASRDEGDIVVYCLWFSDDTPGYLGRYKPDELPLP
jgi:hypothetical protein